MRWDRLFDDLEAQLDAAQRDEFDAEVADRTRRELAVVHIVDRLAGAGECLLQVTLLGVGAVAGSVARTGRDWVLLRSGRGQEFLCRLDAVQTVSGLPIDAATTRVIDSKLGIGHVFRGIARDRSPVTVGLTDGTEIAGTIDRVGADFVDIAVHPLDEPRRAALVTAVKTVSAGAIAVVRSG